MVIQKAVAGDKSGVVCLAFHSQLVDKVEEGKSYIPISFKIHSNHNERYFKITTSSTVVLLEEAILEVQFVDHVINEKVIKLAKIFPVDMKSFETTVKCPTCNAVITEASVGKFVRISFPKGIIHLVLKEDLRSAVLNFIQKKKKIAIYLS